MQYFTQESLNLLDSSVLRIVEGFQLPINQERGYQELKAALLEMYHIPDKLPARNMYEFNNRVQ